MKLSTYNIVKTIKNDTWIFNTLTNAFVKIETSVWENLGSSAAEEYRKILCHHGIMVNDSFNELLKYKYKYYKNAFRDTSIYVAIAPTMKCNFSCFYCFEAGNKTFPMMSESVENALVAFLEKNDKKGLFINWFGGEPLLGFDRILSICEKLNDKEIKFKSSIVTNGSLLTAEKIKQLDALHLTYIQITLDGLAKDHDKRRYFKNGKPSFDIIISNISKVLSKTSIPVTIQVTVDHSNKTAFDDLLLFFQNTFPDCLKKKRLQIGCNHVRNRTDFEKKSLCYTHKDILVEKIKNLQQGNRDARTPFLPGLSMPCMYRCISNLAIDPKGNIYRCLEHLGNPSCKIGNLLEGKISLTRMAEMTFGDDPFEDKECIQCNVFPICGGGCPLDRIKKRKGEACNCCSWYKVGLADLLPYIYENQYNKH